MIHQAYKAFGKMTTVTIKNTFIDPTARTESGFGFIHFETIESARAAVNEGSSLTINGVTYTAEFSKHLKERGEAKDTLPQTQIPSREHPVSVRPSPFIPWIITHLPPPLAYELIPNSPRTFPSYPYPVTPSFCPSST
jgi:RNA recognition motif-containing protein